jgi:hypothetical protein
VKADPSSFSLERGILRHAQCSLRDFIILRLMIKPSFRISVIANLWHRHLIPVKGGGEDSVAVPAVAGLPQLLQFQVRVTWRLFCQGSL